MRALSDENSSGRTHRSMGRLICDYRLPMTTGTFLPRSRASIIIGDNSHRKLFISLLRNAGSPWLRAPSLREGGGGLGPGRRRGKVPGKVQRERPPSAACGGDGGGGEHAGKGRRVGNGALSPFASPPRLAVAAGNYDRVAGAKEEGGTRGGEAPRLAEFEGASDRTCLPSCSTTKKRSPSSSSSPTVPSHILFIHARLFTPCRSPVDAGETRSRRVSSSPSWSSVSPWLLAHGPANAYGCFRCALARAPASVSPTSPEC